MPTVFLLGRPTYFPGLQTAWRKGLFRFLETQEYPSAGYSQPRDAGECPSHCGVFRRDGAIEFGASEPECGLQYYGIRALEIFIRENDRCPDLIGSRRGLFADAAELIQIRAKYAGNASAAPTPASHPSDAFIGLDGGSTSTTAVAINRTIGSAMSNLRNAMQNIVRSANPRTTTFVPTAEKDAGDQARRTMGQQTDFCRRLFAGAFRTWRLHHFNRDFG